MAVHFEDLPIELVEHVVKNLSLPNIQHLHLVSHVIRRNASGAHFKTFYVSRTVDLVASRLDALAAHAADLTPESLTCLLQDLNITGLLYVTMHKWR